MVNRWDGHIKAEQLLTASKAGDVKLMKELKKTLNNKSMAQTVPNSVDGKVPPGTENVIKTYSTQLAHKMI